MKYNLLTILGATAGGKTRFGAVMALKLNGEIISADSRQVYRNMDIGTGKDYDDYIVDGQAVPCHLIDIVDAGEEYNVFLYQKDFYKTYNELVSKNKFPVMCGGTGMYIEAVLKGYKLLKVPQNESLRAKLDSKGLDELVEMLKSYKVPHATTDTEEKDRIIRAIEIEDYYQQNPGMKPDFPEINSLIVGIKFDRNSRRKRITQRLHERLNTGMIEEVEQLIQSGVPAEQLIRYGLEYKFITNYLQGQLSYDEMVGKLNTAIHQFAKRQMTWFRKMEREGYKIHWLDGYEKEEHKVERVMNLMKW